MKYALKWSVGLETHNILIYLSMCVYVRSVDTLALPLCERTFNIEKRWGRESMLPGIVEGMEGPWPILLNQGAS